MFWPRASLASSVCWLACMCKGPVGLAPGHTSTQNCLKLRMEQNLHAIGPQALHTLIMLSERMLKAGPTILGRLESNQPKISPMFLTFLHIRGIITQSLVLPPSTCVSTRTQKPPQSLPMCVPC